MAATSDYAILFIDGFEEQQIVGSANSGWTLVGTVPTFSTAQSYGGNYATAWTSDSGYIYTLLGSFTSNASGDPAGSFLVDAFIETAPNGGTWWFAAFSANSSNNTIAVGITSDLKPVIASQGSNAALGSDALPINTWFQFDLWGHVGVTSNGTITLNVRNKDAAGSIRETLAYTINVTAAGAVDYVTVGKSCAGLFAGSDTAQGGKIWIDNLVAASGAFGAVPNSIWNIPAKGTHMVGSLFPAGAGVELGTAPNVWTGTFANVDDWAGGAYTTDSISIKGSDSIPTAAAFDVGVLAPGVDSLYGIMFAAEHEPITAAIAVHYGYGMGTTNYSLPSTNAATVLQGVVKGYLATDVLSSDTWRTSAVGSMQVVAQGQAGGATNANLHVYAMAIRYFGSLGTAGGSYGFVMG